jgi:hypothetical protein
LSELEFIRPVSEGNFGRVWNGRWKLVDKVIMIITIELYLYSIFNINQLDCCNQRIEGRRCNKYRRIPKRMRIDDVILSQNSMI